MKLISSRQPKSRENLVLPYLERLAAEGGALPSAARIAENLGLSSDAAVNKQMARAQKAGRIAIEHDGRGIVSVTAVDGGWTLRRSESERHGGRLAPKACLRCREPFRPQHARNWTCSACLKFASRVA